MDFGEGPVVRQQNTVRFTNRFAMFIQSFRKIVYKLKYMRVIKKKFIIMFKLIVSPFIIRWGILMKGV